MPNESRKTVTMKAAVSNYAGRKSSLQLQQSSILLLPAIVEVKDGCYVRTFVHV